ncbi:mitochondrial distribution and morphology protein 12 [Geosmithia morbida]|uniref:Mitochondrial distribution and morphology protein 12 n=1 Tax=Geosmithia morbida TaxID=1094350 RepID=A0A9P4Z0D5_9HYPO|nr:mitochondrial distribution and morphology protein 12 [Geosmithia morbida]KAF4124963.1 mitochondrial distribution and morphology protein 12 [Geosmithia morbida]
MSIEVDWDALTSGPDGRALAERIRIFIHDKFQRVPLPRFIKSVTVHGFDFGTVPPSLVLKDITDPLPDFYEEDEGDTDDDDGYHDNMGAPYLGTSTPGILGGPGLNYFHGHLGTTGTNTPLAAVAGAHHWMGTMTSSPSPPPSSLSSSSPSLPSSFPSPPPSGRHSRNQSQGSMLSVDNAPPHSLQPQQKQPPPPLREKGSVSTLAPTSANTSRPPTRDAAATAAASFESAITEEEEEEEEGADGAQEDGGRRRRRRRRRRREPKVDDFQSVFRITYSGDVRLNLTAEILLDYPMPSFVGIPLKLNITGLSFDGVGVLAKIRKRLHFCFLSPEDAMAAVGPDDDEEQEREGEQKLQQQQQQQQQQPPPQQPQQRDIQKQQQQQRDTQKQQQHKGRFGGLLQEIKVESEIGEREGGKQSLKNVGKVERFVLEQVRRIFEEEFVYPSFWTFLV